LIRLCFSFVCPKTLAQPAPKISFLGKSFALAQARKGKLCFKVLPWFLGES